MAELPHPLRLTLLALAWTAGAAPVSAQPAGDEVRASAVVYAQRGATRAQASLVSIGLRRGIQRVEGVRFVHPVDALASDPPPAEVVEALAEREPVADMVRTGNARAAASRADRIVEVLEANLGAVSRTDLVDARMLAALSRCQAGRRRPCEARLADVVAYREGLRYDPERYPPEQEAVFAAVRDRALAGPRSTLRVETDPPGAEVYVDGRSYGPSPADVPELLGGPHYVTLKTLGFQRLEVRADLEAGEDRTVLLALPVDERSQLIVSTFAQSAVRAELGEPVAGDNLRSLGRTLGVEQVVVGTLQPASGGRMRLTLYLYHVGTRNLQARLEESLPPGLAGMDRARDLAGRLYAEVDLSGALLAPEEEPLPLPAPEVVEQWWFWAAVIGGAALVGGAVAIGVSAGGSQVPSGFIRVEGQLP